MGGGKHICARGEEKEGPLCPCPPSRPPVEALMPCGLLDSGNLQQSTSVHFPSVHPHFPSSPPPPHPAPTPPVHTSTHPTHLHLAIQKLSLHHPLVHLTVHLSSVQRPGLACCGTQDVGSGSGLTADREVSVTGSMQAMLHAGRVLLLMFSLGPPPPVQGHLSPQCGCLSVSPVTSGLSLPQMIGSPDKLGLCSTSIPLGLVASYDVPGGAGTRERRCPGRG